MKFFTSLWKSPYDGKWFNNNEINYTFGTAFWRYTRISFIVLFIMALYSILPYLMSLGNIHNFPRYIDNISARTSAAYPHDAIIEISAASGVVTNTTGPILISFGSISGGSEIDFAKGRENIVVVDVNAGIEDINKYKTSILITKSFIAYQRSDMEVKYLAINDILEQREYTGTIVITSGSILDYGQLIKTKLEANKLTVGLWLYGGGALGVIIGVTIAGLIMGLRTAILLLLYAFIVLLVTNVFKKMKYTYRQAYSLAAFGYVVPFLIGLIWSNPRWERVFFLFIIAAILTANMKKIPKDDSSLENESEKIEPVKREKSNIIDEMMDEE